MLCNHKSWFNTSCFCGTGAFWDFCDVLSYFPVELGLSGGFWDAVRNCELLWEYYKICDALGDFCGFADEPTPSLHAHFQTWRLGMCNCNQVKPECLAFFLIESHSFSLVLIIICLSLPLSRFLLSLLPPSTLYPTSPYHTLSYLYTSVLTLTTTPRPFLPGPRP